MVHTEYVLYMWLVLIGGLSIVEPFVMVFNLWVHLRTYK